MKALLRALLAALACCIASALARGSGKPNPYTLRESGLVEWNVRTNVLPTKSRIAAFADVNNDKFVDLVAVVPANSGSGVEIVVMLWRPKDFAFAKVPRATIHVAGADPIVSVVPGDFNYDGFVDFLVVVSTDGGSSYKSYLYLQVYESDTQMSFHSTNNGQSIFDSVDQVLVMDFNGDMIPDVFGANITGMSTFWSNHDLQFASNDGPNTDMLLKKRSSLYADLSGDCLADLIFVANSKENERETYIGISKAEQGENRLEYNTVFRISTDQNVGPIALIDVDTDGHLDIVYTLKKERTWYFVIHFNLVPSSEQGGLCLPTPGSISFDSLPVDMTSNANVVIVKLSDLNPKWSLYTEFEKNVIRHADIDNNGSPDLLVTMLDSTNRPWVVMLTPELCNHAICGSSDATARHRKYFRINTEYDSKLHAYSAHTGAFMDLGENGVMDVMLIDNSASPVKFLLNNSPQETFFLKTLVSNGVCPGWCGDGDRFPLAKPYGVHQTGVSVKFAVTGIDGTKLVRCGAQLVQSAYTPLQTPYSLLGIGRTNNYIETFTVGVSSHHPDRVAKWTAVIPNSQLVVFPYPVTSPSSWLLELYVSPSSNFFWVALAVISTSVALIIVIAFLHWKENKEDIAEQRRAEHFFTF